VNISADVVDDFLFGTGMSVDDYYIERTPISEILCYRGADGRDFDLPIHDEALAVAVHERLKTLDVRVIDV
jgi:hypothetical protein